MSSKRKLARTKKKNAEKDLKQKLNMFDRIPEVCNVCYANFDKTDREQVQSWYVVERRKQKTVNLYCPSCWKEGTSIIEQIATEKKLATKKVDKLDYFMNKVRREREELEARIKAKEQKSE